MLTPATRIPTHDSQLVRGLTVTSTTALVIGSIIGTGVFFKAAIMSQQVGSPALVLAAWLVAGLLSLAGALTNAELGAMLPHAGHRAVALTPPGRLAASVSLRRSMLPSPSG